MIAIAKKAPPPAARQTTPPIEPLTAQERRELVQCCETIDVSVKKASAALLEMGKALSMIAEKRLHRETHCRFADFCKDRFRLSITQARRLMDSAKYYDRIRPIAAELRLTIDRPHQLETLFRLEEDDLRAVLTTVARDTKPNHEGQLVPFCKDLATAVRTVVGWQHRPVGRPNHSEAADPPSRLIAESRAAESRAAARQEMRPRLVILGEVRRLDAPRSASHRAERDSLQQRRTAADVQGDGPGAARAGRHPVCRRSQVKAKPKAKDERPPTAPPPRCLHELHIRADGLYECKRCHRVGRRRQTGWIEWLSTADSAPVQ